MQTWFPERTTRRFIVLGENKRSFVTGFCRNNTRLSRFTALINKRLQQHRECNLGNLHGIRIIITGIWLLLNYGHLCTFSPASHYRTVLCEKFFDRLRNLNAEDVREFFEVSEKLRASEELLISPRIVEEKSYYHFFPLLLMALLTFLVNAQKENCFQSCNVVFAIWIY